MLAENLLNKFKATVEYREVAGDILFEDNWASLSHRTLLEEHRGTDNGVPGLTSTGADCERPEQDWAQ